MLAIACLGRRRLAAAALAPLLAAVSLCACGGPNDPTQPPAPKVMLAAAAATSTTTQAAGDFEVTDDGSVPATAPVLAITGLGQNNRLQPGALRFRLVDAAPTALQDDSDGLLSGPDGMAISLKSYWTFDAASGTFSIGATAMQQLLAALPNGSYDVNLNFVSQDGEFTASYALIVIKSGSVLQGQLRTPAGGDATGLAGKKMLLAGYNSHQRQVAVVDATGAFHFDGVLPDACQLTLNDLVHPNVVSVSAVVFNSSSNVNVDIVYPYATAWPCAPRRQPTWPAASRRMAPGRPRAKCLPAIVPRTTSRRRMTRTARPSRPRRPRKTRPSPRPSPSRCPRARKTWT